MRRSTRILATLGMCLLAAGCGSEAARYAASGPTAETSPSQGWRRADTPADVSPGPLAAESPEAFAMDSGLARSAESASRSAAAPYGGRSGEGPENRRQVPRSGQLTAGSIDDVERPDEFCMFLDQMLGSGAFAGPLRDTRPRLAFQVTSVDGAPIGGAELTLVPTGARQAPLRLTCGSDGRALLAASDLDVQVQSCDLTIRPPGASRPVRRQISLEQKVCRIILDDFPCELPRQLDLALIIDTTGSMGDELEYLKTEIDDIVARLRMTFPNVDPRFALVVYRDQGDSYVSRSFDFTRSLKDLRGNLSAQHAAGGGDHPEAVHVALQQAAGLDWRAGNVARVAFLVGDAPPHDSDMPAAFEATDGLRARGVRLFPVASSGVDLKAEFIMRSAALLTMGQYLFLTDHSGIGNPHAAPHTSQYLVEHLDQLMVRMITSELCGRRLQPDEVLAIERGDMELPFGPGPIPPEQQQRWQGEDRPGQAASLSLPEGAGMWLTLGAVLLAVFAYDSLPARRDE